MLKEPWRAELLGRTTLRGGGDVYDRFRERKIIALFALLSLPANRSRTRAELIETLWPDELPDVCRNRFRVTLHHLRHLLEPMGVAPGSVLMAGRDEVSLHPAAFTSDVNDFRALLDEADKCAEANARVALRERAALLYQGEFLPGYDDEWACRERDALARGYFSALRGLSRDLLALKETARGLVWAHLAIEREPLEEEACFDVMRLYATGGQISQALRCYEQFESLLARELGAQPSPATQKLAAVLRTHLGHAVPAPATTSAPAGAVPKKKAAASASMTAASEFSSVPAASLPVASLLTASLLTASPTAPDSATGAAEPDGARRQNAPRQAADRQTTDPEPARVLRERATDTQPALPPLPLRLTRFFGREHDIAALCALLAPAARPPASNAPAFDLPASGMSASNSSTPASFYPADASDPTRLVTLAGPGGIGKTRLALETADRLLAAYKGRVFFVGLEDAVLPQQFPAALQSALRLPSSPHTDALTQAIAVLGQGPCLLALDNLEHLLPDVCDYILPLLAGASGLRCLITSRRSTGIEGEREYALQPLALPDADASLDSLREYAGIALFLDRARARRADFRLTPQNAPDILRLCHLLEGQPLALELAAARVRVMSAREMCVQFTHALEWLVDARGGKEERHRSLRAAIAWSHRMLGATTMRCFHLCSIFAGGFTTDMAVWMCAPTVGDAPDVLQALDELCAASLLTGREDADGVMRFAMLESLRAFALEQLAQGGEEQSARSRHLEWVTQQMSRAAGEEEAYFALASSESANLRAALAYGLSERAARSEQRAALVLVALLPDHWRAQGSLTEGRDWLRQALCLPVMNSDAGDDVNNGVALAARIAAARVALMQGDYAEADALAKAVMPDAQGQGEYRLPLADSHYIQGLAAFNQGHYPPAHAHMEAALALYRALDAARQQAECLGSLGIVTWYQGDHATALRRVQEALHIQRARKSRRGIAGCLLRMGNIVRDRGDLEAGKPLLYEALQTFRSLGDIGGIASALHDLGVIAMFQGDEDGATQRFEDAGRQFHAGGLRHGYASCLHNLGRIEINAERWETGRARMQAALDVHRQMGDRRSAAAALHNLAEAAQGTGRLSEARGLLLEALAMDREMGSPISVAQHLHSLADVYDAMGQQTQADAVLSEALAIHRTVDVSTDLAAVLMSWALRCAERGHARPAARLLGAVTSYRRTIAFAASPRDRRDLARVCDLLRCALGEQAFEEYRTQGAALSLEQATDETENLL